MFMEEGRQEGRETKRGGGRGGRREGGRERENLYQVKIHHLPSLCQNTAGQCQIRGRGQVCDLHAIHIGSCFTEPFSGQQYAHTVRKCSTSSQAILFIAL